MKNFSLFVYLAICLVIPFASQGQNSRFLAGISGSVDSYKHNQGDYWRYTANNSLKGSLGLSFYAQLGSRVRIKSGLLYSDKGFTLKYTSGKGEYIIDGDFYPLPETITRKILYLDVPVLFGVKVLEKGRFALVPAVGVVNSFLLKSESRGVYSNGEEITSNTTPSKTQMYAAAAFELSLTYQASDRIQFGLAPYFRTRIDIGEVELYSPIPKSYGTSADVRYCF